jgi:hypothetical protein
VSRRSSVKKLLRFALLAICAAGILVGQSRPVWVGVAFNADKDGLRVLSLPYDSPARKAGMRVDDVIVAMDAVGPQGDVAKWETEVRASIAKHSAGDEVTFRVLRDAKPLEIKVRVENRPAGIGGSKPYSPTEARGFPKTPYAEEQLAASLIKEFSIGKDYDDLRRLLAERGEFQDLSRLARVSYIQHDPFRLRSVASDAFDQLSKGINTRNASTPLRLAADWLDAPLPTTPLPPLKTGLSLEQHLDQLVGVLKEARAKRDEAFASLTEEERKVLADNSDGLLQSFADFIALETDPNAARFENNGLVIALATRVDYTKLFEGAALLWRVADDRYLDDLELSVRKAWEAGGRPAGVFIDRVSPIGKIVVGGAGTSWYTEDAAILLDLGGNDFYTNNAGSPRATKIPVAMQIDFAGNDAYEATFNWTQGAALMSHGLLIDRKGDDEYIGQQWAQGAAVLGTALFLDESGNDTYRGVQYTQAVAAWGIAIQMDYAGDDVYESHLLSQGVALPRGAGWLLDGAGNDRYYAKGLRATSYGDPGIFDSWSQGCGVGFRAMQSGGAALLFDLSGRDRYEAGNFSQGGGYYFGIGMLRDAGNANDAYIGSRYNQAFAAHQAIGYLEDDGGDDYYTARHAVAQSIAWDESITSFIDHAGNDVYEGGASFAQGASAHNSFAVFLDLGGKNRFEYRTPPGTAGPNDFNGGTSFSLFVSADERGNTYSSKVKSPGTQLNGDHGLFVDLRNSIEAYLRSKPGGRS